MPESLFGCRAHDGTIIGKQQLQRKPDLPHLKNITDERRQSAKVTRIFNRCHAHGLIAKIPRAPNSAFAVNEIILSCFPTAVCSTK